MSGFCMGSNPCETLAFVLKNRIEERDLELLKNYQQRFGMLDKLCDII